MLTKLNLEKFNRQQLEEYYSFLDLIIKRFGLEKSDERFVFLRIFMIKILNKFLIQIKVKLFLQLDKDTYGI